MLIEQAKQLAYRLHANQTDKAGQAYIHHLKFAADQVAHLGDEFVVVAWLHDSVEDTHFTLNEAEALFGSVISKAIDAITKRPNEPYLQYLERVKANEIARQVKLADLSHNMDLSRLNSYTEKDLDRVKKYQQAKSFLET
ncbi:HD domain-containing protein [Rodentibacter haemolyticus]|uniref:Bifunctional (P)ppGpp synthetase/guanosine-3',5'-bis(Diphosphate) 3'-pyrophosphohydrolase n=1 Tax=Rodentibacter haemolyticus TaxID=2778911 RepID=A0ABX6V1M8_9PAST|nr:HD domain-containing protein [Rodentibacter haemolyticus]QPB42216.1 bifunctional (p)ppGpp synthetase/guanosine-3',5'-bis(diphosphate) 3'-pyrophosphohydrolase [Rodentibacter haemolyticus]